MFNNLRFKIRWLLPRLVDKFWMKLAWMLPRPLVTWASVRMICAVTYDGNQKVPEIRAMDALKNWIKPVGVQHGQSLG